MDYLLKNKKQMIEYLNDKIVVKPNSTYFFKGIDKKELPNLLLYLYYYYDKESPLSSILPFERVELAVERANKLDISKYKELISKYEKLKLSPVEQIALSMSKRIEKIIKTLDEDEVDITDLEKEGKNMKALTEIFKLQDILAEKLAKENKVVEGKGSKSVGEFEDLTF